MNSLAQPNLIVKLRALVPSPYWRLKKWSCRDWHRARGICCPLQPSIQDSSNQSNLSLKKEKKSNHLSARSRSTSGGDGVRRRPPVEKASCFRGEGGGATAERAQLWWIEAAGWWIGAAAVEVGKWGGRDGGDRRKTARGGREPEAEGGEARRDRRIGGSGGWGGGSAGDGGRIGGSGRRLCEREGIGVAVLFCLFFFYCRCVSWVKFLWLHFNFLSASFFLCLQ